MSTKTVTINYFRAEFDGEAATAQMVYDCLRHIIGLKAHDRVKTIGEDRLMLGEFEKLDRPDGSLPIWKGQMRRLRSNDRVAEGDELGYIGDVPLSSGRHVTELAHFLFVPKYKTVVYQGSPLELGWTQMRAYLDSFQKGKVLHMLPVISHRQAEKLKKMTKPTKFVLTVSNPKLWYSTADPSMRSSLEAGGNFSAERMTIEYSASARGGNSLMASIKSVASKMASLFRSGTVTDLTNMGVYLEGYTDGSTGREKVSIDFIEDRIFSVHKTNMTNVLKVDDWKNRCYALLQSSFDAHAAEVHKSCKALLN